MCIVNILKIAPYLGIVDGAPSELLLQFKRQQTHQIMPY